MPANGRWDLMRVYNQIDWSLCTRMEVVWLEWEVVQRPVPHVEGNLRYWSCGKNVHHLTFTMYRLASCTTSYLPVTVHIFTLGNLTLGKSCHLNGQTTDNRIYLINSITKSQFTVYCRHTDQVAILSLLSLQTVAVQDLECCCNSTVLCISIPRLMQWLAFSCCVAFTTPIHQVLFNRGCRPLNSLALQPHYVRPRQIHHNSVSVSSG
jgi:hypothetical protein